MLSNIKNKDKILSKLSNNNKNSLILYNLSSKRKKSHQAICSLKKLLFMSIKMVLIKKQSKECLVINKKQLQLTINQIKKNDSYCLSSSISL